MKIATLSTNRKIFPIVVAIFVLAGTAIFIWMIVKFFLPIYRQAEQSQPALQMAMNEIQSILPDSNPRAGFVGGYSDGKKFMTLEINYTSSLPGASGFSTYSITSLKKIDSEEILPIVRIIGKSKIEGYGTLTVTAFPVNPRPGDGGYSVNLDYKDVVDIAENPNRPLYLK